MKKQTIAIAAALLATTPALANPAQDEQAYEIQHMQWFKNTSVTLPISHGRLVIPQGYGGVLGHDAARMDEIENGKTNIGVPEAAIFSKDVKSQVDFDFVSTGYIPDDDAGSIDPATLLQTVADNTEAQNKERVAAGLPTMHALKWLQQPTYDRTTHTVFWAIEFSDSNNEDVVNSAAVRLGREGFERLTLITTMKDYQPIGGALDVMRRDFSFAPGEAYEDHISSDKVAGYGIAGLVGALVGAHAVKAAAAGGALVLLKALGAKLFALLLLPLVLAKSLIRRWLGRDREAS